MRARMDLWVVIGILAVVAILPCAWQRLLARTPVPLYPGTLPPSRLSEISRQLDTLHFSHTLVKRGIEVAREERSPIIGALLSCGLPLPPPPTLSCHLGPEMTPEYIRALEGRLVEDLRHMDGVADAHVTVLPEEDQLLTERQKPWVEVRLTFKTGHTPRRVQIEAVRAHVAWSAEAGSDSGIQLIVDRSQASPCPNTSAVLP